MHRIASRRTSSLTAVDAINNTARIDAPIVDDVVCIDSDVDFSPWPHGGNRRAYGHGEKSGVGRTTRTKNAISSAIVA